MSYVCVNDDIVEKMVSASPFYRHKEGRSTCTGRSKVVVFSPNWGRAMDAYCRKYTVRHRRAWRRAWRLSWESSLVLRRSRRRPGSSSGRHGGSCRGYRPLRSTWRRFEGPAGRGLDRVKVRAAPEGRAHAVRGFHSRENTRSRQHSGGSSAEHIRTVRRRFPQCCYSAGMVEQ